MKCKLFFDNALGTFLEFEIKDITFEKFVKQIIERDFSIINFNNSRLVINRSKIMYIKELKNETTK